MSLEKLLPPFICDEDKTYLGTLVDRLDLYLTYLKESQFNEFLSETDIDRIKNVSDGIIKAIKQYLSGKSGDAFETIRFHLDSCSDIFNEAIYKLTSENILIRIRQSVNELHYRKELFHIPFNQRYKVSTQRYSIEGLPCLYLASCSFTAWLELGRPNFNELWVAGFEPNSEIPTLDLAFTLSLLLEDLESDVNKNNIISRLMLYPFVLSTSFRTKYPSAVFHEEYIISCILLQWITTFKKRSFMGIRYLSTKLEAYKTKDLWKISNFVMPPQDYSENEIYNSQLCQMFMLTYPQHWSVLTAYSNAGSVSARMVCGDNFSEKTEKQINHETVDNIDNFVLSGYTATRFYNIDGYLRVDISKGRVEL